MEIGYVRRSEFKGRVIRRTRLTTRRIGATRLKAYAR